MTTFARSKLRGMNPQRFKSLDDLSQTNDPPRRSATGVGSTGYDVPRLLEEAFGFKFRVISGYPGAEQDLAIAGDELQALAKEVVDQPADVAAALKRHPEQMIRRA